MVKKEFYNNKTVYTCIQCGFHYSGRADAEECENFCEVHKSCSTKITKKALHKGGEL